MTTHLKACVVAVLILLIGGEAFLNGPHSVHSFAILVFGLPMLAYVLTRIVLLLNRVRIVVLPYEEFIPRCYTCEDNGNHYSAERTAVTITEKWNSYHRHSVDVKRSDSIKCDHGHFLEFRHIVVKDFSKKERRIDTKRVAAKLRALRLGFHNMYSVDRSSEKLDAQS